MAVLPQGTGGACQFCKPCVQNFTMQGKTLQQLQWCYMRFLALEDAFSWLLAAIK